MFFREYLNMFLIITPTNAQLVLLYTVRLHVSIFIGHHQGTMEDARSNTYQDLNMFSNTAYNTLRQ
jgi:hypothetical protein